MILLHASAPVLERFARDHVFSRLLRQQEVETQIHTDKKGCTQMARMRGHRLGPERMSGRPAFALSLLVRVHLRFHFLAFWRQTGSRVPPELYPALHKPLGVRSCTIVVAGFDKS